MGLKDEFSGLTESVLGSSGSVSPVKKRVLTAPGQLFGLTDQQRRIEQELKELRDHAGAPKNIQRSQLRPSPYQTRTISEAAVRELAENLRENDLATALTVRQLEPDVFEIVAGHRRDAAFGLLGRAEIPCVVVKMTDEQAERAVFFDNFFPPEICDYEKYLGLRQIQERHSYTHEELARRSGISKTLVTFLMAFERLPEGALAVLKAQPALLGASAAQKLAQLDVKLAPRLVEGLQLVAQGKLKQAQLNDWITQTEVPKTAAPTVIRAGNKTYATVVRRNSRITVDFSNLDDATALEQKIAALIKEHSKSAKS